MTLLLLLCCRCMPEAAAAGEVGGAGASLYLRGKILLSLLNTGRQHLCSPARGWWWGVGVWGGGAVFFQQLMDSLSVFYPPSLALSLSLSLVSVSLSSLSLSPSLALSSPTHPLSPSLPLFLFFFLFFSSFSFASCFCCCLFVFS